MKDSGLDTDELILPRRAQGYSPGAKGLETVRSESLSFWGPAGAMYSTTGDLLKWEHGLFGGKVLSADSLKEMTTARDYYGLGVGVQDEDGLTLVSHLGGIEGFNSNLMYVPERKVAVIVLSNVTGDAAEKMGAQLMEVAFGETVVLDSERTAAPISKEELAKFVGVYDMSPTFSVTIALAGNGLTMQGTGQPAVDMMFEGSKDGHPRFWIAKATAEIEFLPDAKGAIVSLIVHQGGNDVPARRR